MKNLSFCEKLRITHVAVRWPAVWISVLFHHKNKWLMFKFIVLTRDGLLKYYGIEF